MDSSTEWTYRLEFNEKQQHFHLDNYIHEEKTNGYITICDHCTDMEFFFFEAYISRTKKRKLTNAYLLQCLSEVKRMLAVLLEYQVGLRIDFTKNQDNKMPELKYGFRRFQRPNPEIQQSEFAAERLADLVKESEVTLK